MEQKEKQLLYIPKQWALYCNNEFIASYPSRKSAKAALHRKCEEIKKYPYDYNGEYYTIKPYNMTQEEKRLSLKECKNY